MSHTVLARKWRPKKFSDLIGQHSTVTILQNIINNNRLHHAYLLTGTRGVGKTTIARIIAKALNCLSLVANEPCGTCNNCKEIDAGRFIDVIEIDAASNTGVDNIREVLENAQYAPTSGKYKIYIIDEVHMLSKSAFNAMLKTLEEPPAHIIFILATTDPQKVPITILSRCLQLKLRNLSSAEIATHLAWVLEKENLTAENKALNLLADAAFGSMRDALSLTDQAIAFANNVITENIVIEMLGISDDKNILAILEAIQQQDSTSLIKICERLNQDGQNLENILQQINQALFQIGLAQLTPQPQVDMALQQLAKQISLQDCQLYFEISTLGLEQINKAKNQYPIFVMTLLRMLAFNIGSSEQKQIIIQNNNTTTEIINQQSTLASNKTAPLDIIKPQITEVAITPKENPPWENQVPIEKSDQALATKKTEIVEEISIIIPDAEPLIEIAAAIPNLNTAFNGDWLAFVSQIKFTDLENKATAVILRNSELDYYHDQQITLRINDTFRDLVTHDSVDNLEQLLFNIYQQHFDLDFNFVATTEASYKNHEINQNQQKQLDAEQSIQKDPIIQDLISNFSAKIIPNTIKPID